MIGIFFKTCDLELPASREEEEEATAQRIDLKISAKAGGRAQRSCAVKGGHIQRVVSSVLRLKLKTFEFSRQFQQQL